MYIPLFNKSNYTMLSSLLKIDDIVNFAKNSNISSIALTDINMYSTMEFIKKCENNNIKPIVGLELLLEEFNILVYAKNYEGYKSLIKLSVDKPLKWHLTNIKKNDINLTKNQAKYLLYK